jgi:uncharacterized protein (DUF488 family)
MKAVILSTMIYRKKILLSIFNEFGGTLEKLSLQKLLFLYCNEHSTLAHYEFLPYKYGAFSFAANTDLTSLKKAGYLQETETTWEMLSEHDLTDIAPEVADYLAIVKLKKAYSDYNADDLVKYTYKKYPYYATNSVIAQRILDKKDYEIVTALKSAKTTTGLFTIGYEGKTVDSFFNLLLRNGIKLLCDVRKNAYSMKPGFSKAQLKPVCDSVGITYIHYSELGIASQLRKELHTQADYDMLFSNYVNETLTVKTNEQKKLLEDYKHYGNAALTCFERDPVCCHRSRLAESLMLLSKDTTPIQHL